MFAFHTQHHVALHIALGELQAQLPLSGDDESWELFALEGVKLGF